MASTLRGRTPNMPEPPLRILLVEDDPAYAELTRAMLNAAGGVAMTLDHATSVHSAVDKLADRPYDTVLLDLGLPDAQELEALNSLVGAAPDLPLVILTGTENEVLALQAVKGGAQDYLIKGQATPELLVRAIRYAIERKQSEMHIRHLAYYDPLTQLPNRRLLIEHLGHALKRAARADSIVGAFFIDVDNFKQINDTLGHPAGDEALRQVARTLSRTFLRRVDFVCRYGGDEFAVILQETAIADAFPLGDKLRRGMREVLGQQQAADPLLDFTLSVGVAELSLGDDAVAWTQRADLALYQAKHAGKDQVAQG